MYDTKGTASNYGSIRSPGYHDGVNSVACNIYGEFSPFAENLRLFSLFSGGGILAQIY